MRITTILGAVIALFTGMAIGTQSTITSRIGSIIGDVRTGLFTNFIGGLIAGSLVLVMFFSDRPQSWKMPGVILGFLGLSGLLGIFIITGISFSLQRAGIAAGLATVILGQLVLSTLIDTLGIGGVQAIPLSFQRVLGLLITGLGVFLLLPRN